MANIHRGKNKLKSVTVADIAYEGRPQNQIFMQNNQKEKVKDAIAVAAMLDPSSELIKERERRKAYNENIFNLDPRFDELFPLHGSFICRMMVRTGVKTETGLLLLPNTTARGKTRNGFDDDPIRDPFDFISKAVVVKSPAGERSLLPGSIIQVVTPRTIVDAREAVAYEDLYLHPDYEFPKPPTNVDDPDFGYVILPYSRIRTVVKFAENPETE